MNQFLNLVQNTNMLPGFESLDQVEVLQDIFKAGFTIFKNDGEMAYSDVTAALKGFLKSSGFEEEVKDMTGVGILDVLKVVEEIVGSFKNQNKTMGTVAIKKIILNLIGATKFVEKRSRIKNLNFVNVGELRDNEDCEGTRGDVATRLKEIETEIQDLN